MGSRLNLYCGVEEGKEGYRSALGLGGGDGTTYRCPRCIRGAARVAPGVPARDTPARSKGRTFAPSWLFLGWIRKSGRRGTHGQLVAVLRPPPVRLRGLIPVLLPVRTEGKGRTSEPVRQGARDGARGRRRGNPRRGAIRWNKIDESRVMGAAGNSHLLALRHRRRHVLLEIRLTLRRVFHLPGEPSREETHRASSRARTALRCTAENESYLPLFVCL